MSLLDALRGRPQPGQLSQLVENAAASLPHNPEAARLQLERLGTRVWTRAADEATVELGFALRSHASWLLGDHERAIVDLDGLGLEATHAGSLLPIVPVLAEGASHPDGVSSQRLTNRFGGCGNESCTHPPYVDAGIAIIRSTTDPVSLSRWAASVRADDDGASLRIAAYRRAVELVHDGDASILLNGDHPRLVQARASLAYAEGRYEDVVAMLPAADPLAARAALAMVLRRKSVPATVKRIAEAFAAAEPAARALLAEREARFSDAAVAWSEARRPEAAQDAAVLASPTSPFDASSVRPSMRWFAHAAGLAPRPDAPPITVDEKKNADVGAAREYARALRDGTAVPPGEVSNPAVRAAEDILVKIAETPAVAESVLSAADPTGPPASQLAIMAAAPTRRGGVLNEAWRAWNEAHESRPGVPRPTAPLRWLANPAGGSTPMLRQVAPLAPERRIPVLAAMVHTGAPTALIEAVALLDRTRMAGVAQSALPELAPLGHAVAARADLSECQRRDAAVVAAAALANRVARGTTARATASEAVRFVSLVVGDLAPDPVGLTPEEAFRIEHDALQAFLPSSRRRAVGPVLSLVSGVRSPVDPPDEVSDLYGDDALAVMLLRVGRVEAAHAAFLRGSCSDASLAAGIGAALAKRHLTAGRPYAALRELASIPDPEDLLVVDGSPLEDVASAVVRDGGTDGLDQAIADSEVLLKHFDYMDEITMMGVELRLRRARHRPGSASLDLPDLERAFAIDPSHPRVPRQLAYALVTKAMEEVELKPAAAVLDVDRATDIFMGDHEMAVMASRIATHAAFLFIDRSRDRLSARKAIDVALAIDPNNRDALMARNVMQGGR